MKQIRFISLFFLFISYVYAEVNLRAPSSFIKGEPYYFEIEAVGSSIEFPTIDKIDGFTVENQGTSKSLQIINGNYNEKLLKRYKIVPNREFTIPSLKFKVDDKEVLTKEKKVVLQLVAKTDSSNFDLTLYPSKSELYVGEDLLIKLIFKYKKDLQITNLGFEKPHFENFWYKRVDNKNDRYEQNGYIVQELDFLLFPQKSGELTVGPLRVDAQMISGNTSTPFGFFSTVPKEEKIYSNKLNFNVKKLPDDVTLIGNFDINGTVDKTDIKKGDSISLKLDITGMGNFDDIQDIKLNIPNATIYDNKPNVKSEYTAKGYEGEYSKIFSIIPESSIEIPSITLKYFDKKENKVIVKKSKSFKINVEETKSEKKVLLEKPKEQMQVSSEKQIVKEDISNKERIKYFIFGIIATLLIFSFYKFIKAEKKKKASQDTPLEKLVKGTKNKNEMMKILVPHLKKDAILDQLIFDCESEKEFKILRKEILNRLKEIKI